MTDKFVEKIGSRSRHWRLLAASGLIALLVSGNSTARVFGDEEPSVPETANKLEQQTSSEKALGLDRVTLNLVNHGRFKELIEKLKARVSKSHGLGHATRSAAWLAFAYMYTNDCDALEALAKPFAAAGTNDVNATLIQVFNLMCKKPDEAGKIKFNEADFKKLDEAGKKLQSISAAAAHDAFVNFAFAWLTARQDKTAVALTYLQRTTALAPDFAWGYRSMAVLQQQRLKAPADAEASYAKALAIEPDMTESVNALVDLRLAKSDFDGAIEVAQAAIHKAPRDAGFYFLLVQIYMQQRRFKEASELLKRSIALDPNNPKYFRMRASIYGFQGNLDAAIADLQKAVELSSDKKFELSELAALEVAAGRENDATKHLLGAVALDPGNQRNSGQLVALLSRQGKFDQLVIVLKGTVDRDPKNAVLRMYYADALAADNKITEAEAQYKEAANLNQADPEPHRKLAAIAVSQKNFHQAEKEYTRALNINPNSTEDLVALGYSYAQTDDYLQAEAGYVTALALHQLTRPADSTVPPTRLDIMRSLATLLFKEARYADAAAQFATVCAMSQGKPEAPLDNLMLAQSSALRDRSKSSFAALDAAFNKLSDADKTSQRLGYIDTLLRLGKFDDAIVQLKLADAEIKDAQTKETQAKDVQPKDTQAKEAQAKEARIREALVLVCWSRAWRGKNEIAKAEEAARKAVDVSSKSGAPLSDTLSELGEVYLAKNDPKAAAEIAHRALEINEKAFRAYELLGRISLKEGQANTAMAEANRAIEIDPYFAEAYLVLGDAQVALADAKAASGDAQAAFNGLKDAASSYQKATNLYPSLLPAHESFANALKKLSPKDKAYKEEVQKEVDTITKLRNAQG